MRAVLALLVVTSCLPACAELVSFPDHSDLERARSLGLSLDVDGERSTSEWNGDRACPDLRLVR